MRSDQQPHDIHAPAARRPWYAAARGRAVAGSIGAEWWGSWTTYFLAALTRGAHVPVGHRGYLLDAIGDKQIDGFLLFLTGLCFVHFVLLWLPNVRPVTLLIRKLALGIECMCWTSVAFDLVHSQQYGSLVGLVVLVVLMMVGICRKTYPDL